MAIATAAFVVSNLPFVAQQLHLSALLLVILFGMAIGSAFALPDLFEPGVRLAQRPLLRWAVAGLGFRLSLAEIVRIGGPALVVVILSTTATLAFGWWCARRLGLPEKQGILLGVGSAICGASAVVAADSVVQADKRDSAIALGTITLLGTIGIVLYPVIGRGLGMGDQLYGLWDGASLHELAQVVAAGFGMSDEAARIATVVKLARIALLAPTVLYLAWTLRHEASRGSASAFPWFLGVFLLCAAVNSAGALSTGTVDLIRRADLWLLCVAMAGVGLETRLRDIRDAGIKPLLAGALMWLFLSVVSLGLAGLLG
jgi:uncharacterized integral membrane protein (TIGR00698 family)